MKYRHVVTLFFFGWSLFFFLLWKNMLVFKADGLYAGHPYVWADWSMHTGLVSSFAYRPLELWFSSHPFFAGAPLNYPFVVNLISGVLVRLGLPMTSSMTVPSLIFSLGLLWAMHLFYEKSLRGTTASLIASLLFLCSGGIGFWYRADILTKIPEKGIEFTNVILGMLVPQRAFLLGMPIGLVILTFLLRFLEKKKVSPKILIGIGILAGLLPIIHTHTYLVIVMMSAWMFIFSYREWRKWLLFGIPATLISTIVYSVFLRSTVGATSFFTWHPGWFIQTGVFDWILFWLKNWGLFFILSIFGTILLRNNRSQLIVTCGWWVIFLVANLVQFQPQTWDNSKLFAWVYLGLAVPAVVMLQNLWQQKHIFAKALVGVLIFISSISGAVDLIHMLDFQRNTYRMLTSEEIEIGQWVQRNTDPAAVFLTPELVSNPIPMISGRSVVMGYSGWVFSYGFPYTDRKQAIESVFAGNNSSVTAIQNIVPVHYLYVPGSETAAVAIYSENIVFENPAGKILQLTK
jgi:hypothetical protein